MASGILHSDFKPQPYWWDAAPLREHDEPEVPSRADVVIVGSGYTGLSAALTLARAGREVVVLDRSTPGIGASTRNAGYVGTSLLAPFSALLAKHGAQKAVAFYGQSKAAFDHTIELIEREQIRCNFARCGRVYWVYTASQLSGLAREMEAMRTHLGKDVSLVERGEIERETGSRLYCGGMLLPETGSVHPGLFHQGLLERAEAAGARVIGHADVQRIVPTTGGHRVETARGPIEAPNVVVSTNAYVGAETPWLRRRILPVNAQMIATEPLEKGLVKRLIPTGRTNLDCRAMFHYWRPSPDGTRILFGGRTGLSNVDPESAARDGHGELSEIFPELEGVGITHAWSGFVCFTRDQVPRIGIKDGVHYAMGMNGAGLPMGTYLGHKTALRLLGESGGETGFDGLKFPAFPLYNGRPWFLPLLVAWARLQRLRERPPQR
jgi:glycine/D-amino acid oxidase-like deaminating enzyme